MKAIVWKKYGAPTGMEIKEVAIPVPKPNEVLIKIHAASVTAGDCEFRGLKLPFWLRLPIRIYMGIWKPRETILGQELSGEIIQVGKEVKKFIVGDEVFAGTGFGFGAYAEYVCLPENGVIAIKPSNMTYEESAVVPTGGLEALHFLRQAKIKEGDNILIIGAGGSIGTFAVQLAKHFGATVTSVDISEKLDMLLSIGSDKVIDYTIENYEEIDMKYDVIFDVVGKSHVFSNMKLLNEDGRYLLGNPKMLHIIRGKLSSSRTTKKIIFGSAEQTSTDLQYLKELIEMGKIKSVIGRTFSLEEVPNAHTYVESGKKIGNVAITIK